MSDIAIVGACAELAARLGRLLGVSATATAMRAMSGEIDSMPA